MKRTTLLIFASALLIPFPSPSATDCKPTCPEQISVYVSSLTSGLPKAQADEVQAAVEQEVNNYAREKPGWKCVCKVHLGGGSKCEAFPMRLTVSKSGTGIDAQLGASQNAWTIVSSAQVTAGAQSLANLENLKQAAISAVDQALSKVHPCGAWSGQISYVLDVSAPDIHDKMRDYTGHGHYETTVILTKGVAGVTRNAHVKSDLVMRQMARRGGAVTLIQSSSDNVEGSAGASSPAMVEISIHQETGTYQILPMWSGEAVGKLHRVTCGRDECTTRDDNFGADQMRQMAIDGKLDDPNHLHGTKTEQASVSRDSINGAETLTITWDLTRSGSDTH